MVVLRALLAGRWLIGAMVLPYALIIARSGSIGGWVGALGITFTLLYALACFDSLMLQRERSLRLVFVRRAVHVSDEALSITRVLLGASACLVALVMLLIQAWLGLTIFAALVLIRLGIGTKDTTRASWILRWIEFTLPLAALMVPYVLTRGYAAQSLRDSVSHAYDPQAAAEATKMLESSIGTSHVLALMLGASILSAALLLCLIRDETADRGAGIATTATALGRRGATLMLTMVAVLAGGISMGGAATGAWSWGIPAVVFVLAQLALWAILTRAERIAAPVWLIAGAVIGYVLLIG